MWTAVALWVINLAGLALYAQVAAHHVAAGDPVAPWIAALPLVYFGIVLCLCAVYFAIAWFWRSRRPRDVRIGWRATLRLVWHEYLTLAGAAPRMMFYGWLVRDPPPARIEIPVLLLHGVLCNAGVWARMARFLARIGVPGVYSLSYGPPLASIETFAEQVAQKIDAIRAATGAHSVMIVAHSMGGVVIRAYIRKHGIGKLARVLTIGSPHHGSMHAWLLFGTSLAQIRPGNAWLAALNRERLDPRLRFVSLWSWHDSMVAPQTSAELPGATDVTVIGVGHNALLGDGEVLERTHAEISAARTEARRTG
jgi:triacylglycerol esterase/lipase EstA (alpha/beta hydrolase family)